MREALAAAFGAAVGAGDVVVNARHGFRQVQDLVEELVDLLFGGPLFEFEQDNMFYLRHGVTVILIPGFAQALYFIYRCGLRIADWLRRLEFDVIILPLIERELRTRARSRALYWTRFAVALGGLLFCLPFAVTSGGMPLGLQAVGHSVFTDIVVAAFVLSCCAGFLTVDRISRERRDGTLGLLYLTRVKELDVLLGSFGAAGIACVCALVAFLPVIMLPVLAGGVTGGEAFRTMLVLLDTLLLSLAAGLWASAGARGWFKSAQALAGMLLLILVTGRLFPWVGLGRCVRLLTPLTTLHLAADASYTVNSGWFWMSLAAVLLISCLLLMAAGFRLRRAMRDGVGMTDCFAAADPEEWRGFTLVSWKIGYPETGGVAGQADPESWPVWLFGQTYYISGCLVDQSDPVRWLVRRQRGIKAAIWAGVFCGVISVFGTSLVPWRMIMGSVAIQPVYQALAFVQGCLFGWAASRFFVEARRSGELELLLTSPVGAKTIVSSQWKELRRLFAWPVTILVALHLIPAAINAANNYSRSGGGGVGHLVVVQSVNCASTIISIGALIWAGLWFGLKARSPAGALARIILFGQVAPYVASLAGMMVMSLFAVAIMNRAGSRIGSSYLFGLYLVPTVAVLLYYVWLIRWARRRLAGELRTAATDRFSLGRLISGARAGLNSVVSKARNWPPAPEG
jgi:ABC-type transport system involved in multi-copper enzyme maturation permease subunit